MSSSINSGLTSITGNVTVTQTNGVITPSSTQTWKKAQGACNGANQTIATVTAGKTAYVTFLAVCGTANDNIAFMTSADSTIIQMRVLANSTVTCSSGAPIAQFAATENIRINGAATSIYSCIYYEQ